MNQMDDLKKFWTKYNAFLLEAKQLGLTSSNLLGEYTEKLCASTLGLELQSGNMQGYDALDASGKRVQIKGRRISKGNVAKLTTLWNLDFDYIVAVIYNSDGSLKFVQKITVEAVERDFQIDKRKNCRRVIARLSDMNRDGYEDLTHLFE